jgi:hypothetical protein
MIETKWQPGMKAVWYSWQKTLPGHHGAMKKIVEVLKVNATRLKVQLEDGSIKHINAENLKPVANV